LREQARNTRKQLREQKAALSELLFGSCNQTIMHFHLDCRHDKRSFSLAAKALACDFSCLRGDIDILASCWLFACQSASPNRTFLVRFGSISGEFGRAMVRILARRSRAKMPMARPNEPDMLSKRTKKRCD